MKRRNLVLGGLAATMAAGMSRIAVAQAATVRFGQSAAMSGLGAEHARDVRTGIVAAFEAATRATVVRYELITLDDGGLPERCVQNVNTLLGSNVAALIGLTSGRGAEAALPAIDQQQMALVAPASGTMGLRGEKVQSAYHVRAGHDLEFQRMVSYARERALLRVGLVHQMGITVANLSAMTQALAGAGIAPREVIAVDDDPASYQAAAQKLSAANLDCVLFVAQAAPVAAVIEQMNAARYRGLFYASSMAGQNLIDTLAQRGHSAILSVVVPRPSALGLPVVSRCQQDLAALRTEARLNVATLEGYISGRIAVEAARQAMRTTGAHKRGIKEAMSHLRADLGGYTVQFQPGSNQGSKYVELVALDRYGRMVG